MPINYQQVYAEIQQIGAGAKARQQSKEAAQMQARALLAYYASRLEELRAKLDSARQIDSSLRCAAPLTENLAAFYPPVESSDPVTLIAADGSQIQPDRHAALQFCVVNVGAILMQPGGGQAPQVFTDTELLYGDEISPNGQPLSEGVIALKRDLAERAKLDELSQNMAGAIVTFTDGPIELWGSKEDGQAFYEYSQKYLGALSRLRARNVITAGYVDKPSSSLVARLLEVACADAEQLRALKDFRPFTSRGVTDRWLFSPLLPPGCRSAVFQIQSEAGKTYKNDLALHFFYLNVGVEHHPSLARVEIPQWVAQDASALNLLHGVLVEQCRLMGSKPYPYLLNRAHEIAVVKHEEKTQIQQLLALELQRRGEELDAASNKQENKDTLALGRKRYS